MDFIYGLAEVKIGENVVGYIEENSFKLNGSEGESTKINAAQVHGAPVLVFPKTNGTIAPTFDMIQMKYENLVPVMGGELIQGDGSKTGWKAPSNLVQVTNSVTIKTDSSHQIKIKKALISGYIDGDLNLDSVAKLKVKLEVMMPDDKSEPYSIEDVSA